MKQCLSFEEFATRDLIISLLAKERAKYAVKNRRRGGEDSQDFWQEQLKPLMPPRFIWNKRIKGGRVRASKNVVSRWTSHRRIVTKRCLQTIKSRLRNPSPEDCGWIGRLNAFVDSVLDAIHGSEPLKLTPPKVFASEKDKKPDGNGVLTCRPICVFTNLRDKILITLAQRYILNTFDPLFGDHMLFMRKERYSETLKRRKVPNFLDAIPMTMDFERSSSGPLYVGECDIQKFYDILNHDVILDCFDKLYEAKREESGCSDMDFGPLTRIIKAFLESFSFPGNVGIYNDCQDDPIWKRIKEMHKANGTVPVCKFGWVKDEDFSSCYTPEEFKAAKDGGKLGIPQGGALSGIIVNVVMREVDKEVLAEPDPDRFFVRYCDDILLIHKDRSRCESLLDIYEKSLISHKLIPHKFHAVSEYKSGSKTLKGYWGAKSKRVFLWGAGEGDASQWIGFVGYEMSRHSKRYPEGRVRLRKSAVEEEMKKIAKRYYLIIKSEAEKTPQEKLDRFDTLSDWITDHDEITHCFATLAQAKRLDNYLFRKARQAGKKLGLSPEEALSAARSVRTFSSQIDLSK